jgi:hypothetical protein
MFVLIIWAALFVLAPIIKVNKETLAVGRVSIPRSLLGSINEIAKDEIFQERGPKLDPAAYRVFQGTVKTAIKIVVRDPSDPTPYWIVSTRRPAQLANVLRELV